MRNLKEFKKLQTRRGLSAWVTEMVIEAEVALDAAKARELDLFFGERSRREVEVAWAEAQAKVDRALAAAGA